MGKTFEEYLPTIIEQIDKRRYKWTLSSVSYDDVKQIILIRVNQKLHTFDETKGEFSHWLSRVITHTISNILRDNLLKWSRPCLKNCPYNLGADHCGFTKSGFQDSTCPLYKEWENKKKTHFNVAQTLTIENHSHEVSNHQDKFIDAEAAKVVIDAKIKDKLKANEWKIYKLLYIDNLSEEETGKAMGYKKAKNSSIPGYQQLKKLQKKVITLAREIIKDNNLA